MSEDTLDAQLKLLYKNADHGTLTPKLTHYHRSPCYVTLYYRSLILLDSPVQLFVAVFAALVLVHAAAKLIPQVKFDIGQL